jgi:tRNA(Ile)-lysidine synthase
VVRPLLQVPRVTTLAYCEEQQLRLVEDASNLQRTYTRNRLRLDLLPLLEQFNPRIRTTLARFADLAREDLAALDALAEERFHTLADPAGEGFRFSLEAWRTQSRALQRRLLRLAVERLAGTLQEVPAGPIEDALDLLSEARGPGAYDLPHGVVLRVAAPSFVLAIHSPVGAAPERASITRSPEEPGV